MKIKLETLQHQTDALNAIDKAFPGMDTMSNDPNANYIYANPLIRYRYNDEANIDIKMETGTGKTYVYTRMMRSLVQVLKRERAVLSLVTMPSSILVNFTKILESS